MSIKKDKLTSLEDISKLKGQYSKCGIVTKVFEIEKEFGLGTFVIYTFGGLSISQFNLKLHHNLKFYKEQRFDSLLFSALIEGEKKITISNHNIEMIQENLEGYISYITTVDGMVSYTKGKKIKEIMVNMSSSFIRKHQLDIMLPIYKKYALHNISHNTTQLIDNKIQNVLDELMVDKRTGILKRLFLESKVLELLSLQIANIEKKQIKNNSITKKIYLAEKFITSNLEIQFTISDLSKKIYLNEYLLKQEFKRIFGQSIFKYSLKKRMIEAKKLLYQTTKPIYEIAELIGYKNATHFTAAFKKHLQLTPKEFRKKRFITDPKNTD